MHINSFLTTTFKWQFHRSTKASKNEFVKSTKKEVLNNYDTIINHSYKSLLRFKPSL